MSRYDVITTDDGASVTYLGRYDDEFLDELCIEVTTNGYVKLVGTKGYFLNLVDTIAVDCSNPYDELLDVLNNGAASNVMWPNFVLSYRSYCNQYIRSVTAQNELGDYMSSKTKCENRIKLLKSKYNDTIKTLQADYQDKVDAVNILKQQIEALEFVIASKSTRIEEQDQIIEHLLRQIVAK